jgi:hypothetical protein
VPRALGQFSRYESNTTTAPTATAPTATSSKSSVPIKAATPIENVWSRANAAGEKGKKKKKKKILSFAHSK